MRERMRRVAAECLKTILPPGAYRRLTAGGRLLLYPERSLLMLRGRLQLRRRLDYPGAELWVIVESDEEFDFRLRPCEKEPETLAWIEEYVRPGDVMYDVGANIGAYSLIAAAATGRRSQIVAIEPVFTTYAALCRNILINGFERVITPLAVGLGDRTAIQPFQLRTLRAGSANHGGFIGSSAPAPGAGLGIPGFRLDDLIRALDLPSPLHMKLDVDGAEAPVLRGAIQALAGMRSLLVEAQLETGGIATLSNLLAPLGLQLARTWAHEGGKVANCLFLRSQDMRRDA